MSGTDLTLIFVNSSSKAGDFSVYQANPGLVGSTVVWFQKSAQPTTRIDFTWNDQALGFAWQETGKVAESITFEASQFWPANLNTTNQVSFEKTSEGYTFANQTAGPQNGELLILQENSVVSDEVLVGVGMAGAPTFLYNAQPQNKIIYKPDIQYWVEFCYETESGSVIIRECNAPEQVIYPTGVTSMTAILNEDFSWDIKTTDQVNADFDEAVKKDSSVVWGLHYKS